MSGPLSRPGRVVVLGGTGHIGSAIARHFDAEDYDVLATGRTDRPRPNLDGTTVRILSGDDGDVQTLARWLNGAALVIDAATPYPVWRYEASTSALVADARARIGQVISQCRARGAALVHVSSFTTLQPPGGVQERLRLATLRGLHPYFAVKEAVEQDVFRALRDGLEGCVVHPSTCFGPFDLKPAQQAFIPMLIRGEVAGKVGHRINVVDVRDVAGCVFRAAQTGFAAKSLPIAGHDIRVDGLVDRVCKIAQVRPPALRAPLAATVMGAYWAETAAAMLGRRARWPSLPLLLTAAGHPMPITAAQARLAVSPRPLDSTLSDAVAWYRQIGHC